MKRCLITGATGAVGPAVVRAFVDAGFSVRVLSRRTPAAGELPLGIDVVVGDLVDGALADATRGIDVVVHMAALLHISAPSCEVIPEYERVNVEGTRRLVAAAIEAGVPRFVYFSTIAVYGAGGGRMMDESTPPAPTTPYASSKLAAERFVLAMPGSIVLRLASVYGPRVKGNYRRLIRALERGTYIPIGRGENRRTLIYEDDVGQAAVLAARSQAQGVFNVTDGSTPTITEIVESIAQAIGKKPCSFHLRAAPFRAVAALADLVLPFLNAGMTLEKYFEDVAIDGRRFQQSVGFAPRYDVRAGWLATIRRRRESRAS